MIQEIITYKNILDSLADLINKSALKKFIKHLSTNNILDVFEKSDWLIDYQKENK